MTVEQGRSTVVNPPHEWSSLDSEILLLFDSETTFDQLTEVRRIVEPEIAALAAERITPAELAALQVVATRLPSETMEQHVERDTRFHLELAKAAKNTVLLIVMSSINELLRESRRRAYVVPGELEKAWQYHQDIYAAIERRDSDAARQLMAQHMGQVAGALARYKVIQQPADEPTYG